VLEVQGIGSERIGELAADHGLVLHELTPQRVSLEDVFMRLTGESVEYHANAPAGTPADSLEPVA
jgi:ABC-2 type transport system ATP-binding protein